MLRNICKLNACSFKGYTQMRLFSSSAWIQSQISQLQRAEPEQTVAVVVDQSEVRDGSLDGTILPKGLATSL